MTPPTRLCLLNPRAQSGRCARLLEPLAQALQARAADVVLRQPQSIGEARAQIGALPAGSRVLVVGGDGTVQQLLPALLAGGHELALIPAGTGNDLARALGLQGMPWQQALDLSLRQTAGRMDVGQVRLGAAQEASVHYFASSLACGFDAAAGAQVERMPLFLPGLLRYGAAALCQFLQLRSYGLQWACDGAALQQAELLLASCLNTPTYASGMRLAPSARVDDGALQLVMAKNAGWWATLGLFARLLAGGRHTRSPAVQIEACQTLLLRAQSQALPLLLDGEFLPPQSQVQVQVLPRALAVVRA